MFLSTDTATFSELCLDHSSLGSGLYFIYLFIYRRKNLSQHSRWEFLGMFPKTKTTTTTLKDINQNVQFVIGNVVLKYKLSFFFFTLPFWDCGCRYAQFKLCGWLTYTDSFFNKMNETVAVLSFLSLAGSSSIVLKSWDKLRVECNFVDSSSPVFSVIN